MKKSQWVIAWYLKKQGSIVAHPETIEAVDKERAIQAHKNSFWGGDALPADFPVTALPLDKGRSALRKAFAVFLDELGIPAVNRTHLFEELLARIVGAEPLRFDFFVGEALVAEEKGLIIPLAESKWGRKK